MAELMADQVMSNVIKSFFSAPLKGIATGSSRPNQTIDSWKVVFFSIETGEGHMTVYDGSASEYVIRVVLPAVTIVDVLSVDKVKVHSIKGAR